MSPEGPVLRRFLAEVLDTEGPGSQSVAAVECRAVEDAGWYGAWSVGVQLSDGTGRRFFLKDFGSFRARKPDMAGRRERERWMYRRLLRPERHGTARYYGSVWEPRASRYWLLLEYVEGTPVRHLEFEAWLEAAAWLARFQAWARQSGAADRASRHLVRRDRRYFLEAADRGATVLRDRLGRRGRAACSLLDGYEEWVRRLTSGTPTIVHGAFLPMQIVASGESAGRLCPLDWELAGVGPPAYDLGFLAYGFEGSRRRALLDVYQDVLLDLGEPKLPDLSRHVACVGVHYTLTELAHGVERGYAEEALLEYLALLEKLLATRSPRGAA